MLEESRCKKCCIKHHTYTNVTFLTAAVDTNDPTTKRVKHHQKINAAKYQQLKEGLGYKSSDSSDLSSTGEDRDDSDGTDLLH